MDTIFIRNLKAEAIIGIYDFERVQKQPVVISLEMEWDNQKPSSTEDVNDALDYEQVSKKVKHLVERSSFQLVETLAETIAKMILQDFKPQALTLTLEKPKAIDFADSVGIQITRKLSDFNQS